LLRDQAQMILALSRAYQVSANGYYLLVAQEIVNKALQEFVDTDSGGFFDLPNYAALEIEPLKFKRRKNIIENALMSFALTELSYLTQNPNYRKAAEMALGIFAQSFSDYGPFAIAYALAAWYFTNPQTTLIVVGNKDDPPAKELLADALKSGFPFTIGWILDPVWEPARLDQFSLHEADGPIAYLCQEGTCQAISDPEKLAEALKVHFER
jgi:uncharacterized protein YyaL (SSP411 family)